MNKLLGIIKYFFWLVIIVFILLLGIVFLPKKNPYGNYVLKIHKGQGISSILRILNKDSIIYNYYISLFFAYILDINEYVKEGFIHLDSNSNSIYKTLLKIKKGPNRISVRIIEGSTFSDIKRYLDGLSTISHNSLELDLKEIQRLIDFKFSYPSMEGFFYPATYYFYEGTRDIDVYKTAYNLMNVKLENYWKNIDKSLPYKDKYQILIMASLIEKETANIEDMSNIAAVFINRLKKNMLLQSDPTVIYALGINYKGRLLKKDLLIDSMYNTYKYKGLPPSAIAIPSKKALDAAIAPANVDYLFFVAKLDGTGKSEFSNNLKDHNNAVKKYILKKTME